MLDDSEMKLVEVSNYHVTLCLCAHDIHPVMCTTHTSLKFRFASSQSHHTTVSITVSITYCIDVHVVYKCT